MKRKILLSVIIGLLSLGSIVSAASLWGTYKGNDIIRLTVNGSPVTVTDVPAINYNSRTMIPIYLLKQAGVNYTWDQENKTVNVTTSSRSGSSTSSFNPTQRTNEIISLGGQGVTIMNISGDSTATVYFNAMGDFESDWDNIFTIMTKLVDFQSTYSRVFYVFNNQENMIEIKTSDIKGFMDRSISDAVLQQRWIMDGPLFTGQSQGGSNAGSNAGTYISSSVPELYSNDGKVYLGKLTSNEYDSESVFNEYGDYGSKYSQTSIWNEYGTYGSNYSDESAFSKYASSPPIIVLDGDIIGYLTINSNISNGISPIGLLSWIENNGY